MEKGNIILIGFMGCGKTTFGKKLSKALGYKFIDMDKYIEKKENRTINEIFATDGEDYFRQKETDVIKELSLDGGKVISTGGGVIKNPKNIAELKKNGLILYLKSTPHRIYNNLKDDTTRPLLADGDKMEKIKTLLGERAPLYEKYADLTANVSHGTVGHITENILKKLEEYQNEKNMRDTRPQP